MELIIVTSCIAILVLVVASFLYVGTPPKGGDRLKFKNKKKSEVLMPSICILTGETATESHPLRMFTASPWHAGKAEIQLPFSMDGWSRYTKAYPFSLRFFFGGFNILMKVPLIGAYFAITLWIPLFGFVAGLISVIDLFIKKRRLVVLKNIGIKDGRITNIYIAGVNKKFVAAFLKANGG